VHELHVATFGVCAFYWFRGREVTFGPDRFVVGDRQRFWVVDAWHGAVGVLWRFALGLLRSRCVIGLGLASLLGAPIRYIMLNEVAVMERAAAQAAATLFTSVGQLVGAALVGAMIASMGGGLFGYSAVYLTTGVVALGLTGLAVGLKPRAAELRAMAAQSAGG